MTQADEVLQDLDERLRSEQPLIAEIKTALIGKLRSLGLRQFETTIENGLSGYELVTDPYDKSQSLCAHWYDRRGEVCGKLQIHGTGQLYAEFDVLLNQPNDKRWFIESVTAWGKAGAVVTDLQLLQSLEQ